MGNERIRRITIAGVMVGLFLVLAILRFRIGGFLEIGLGSLVLLVAALTLSPLDAFRIGTIGELLNQILFSGYGITPTTPLWVAPVAIRGLLLGLIAYAYRRKGDSLTNHKVLYFVFVMAVALFISGLDTGLLYLDGMIMGYPVQYTWIQTIARFGSSQVTAILVALLALPLYRAVSFILPQEKKTKEEQ